MANRALNIQPAPFVASKAPSHFPPTSPNALEEMIQRLLAGQLRWGKRSLSDKTNDLEALIPRIADAAFDWVAAAIRAKGVPEGSSGEGEEWVSGPWALIAGLKATTKTLRAIAAGEDPIPANRVHTRNDGQLTIDAYPTTFYEKILLNGFSAELWMEPGITRDDLQDKVAIHLQPSATPPDRIAAVMGAGNIASIAPLDVLYVLAAENRVAICKLNPVNEYLGPIFARIFAPMIAAGFVEFAYGGAEVGESLVRDARVGFVHITGSGKSHDAIVWGTGAEAEARKARHQPLLDKPIASELGGVGPTIVVPGPWSDADIAFQAEHIASQKLHNAGFNCIASQILVLHKDWTLREKLLEAVESTVRAVPGRPAYYPGAAARQEDAVAHCSGAVVLDQQAKRTRIPNLKPQGNDWPFQSEFFGSVWGEVSLEAEDAASFLDAAVDFANDRLMGTLGAQILIHPQTIKELGDRFEEAIKRLRYGTIGINAWSGIAFSMAYAPWGAFPGHTLEDVQSGRGKVHNAYLLEGTERTVVRGPFAPFPRTMTNGQMHTSPKPLWFVTNKSAAQLGKLLCDFEAKPSLWKLGPLLASALRG